MQALHNPNGRKIALTPATKQDLEPVPNAHESANSRISWRRSTMPSRTCLRFIGRITTVVAVITLLKTIIALDLAPLGLLKLLSVLRVLPKRILLARRRLVVLERSLNLIKLALVRTGDGARPAALAVNDVVAFFLLALALFALHAVHLLAIAIAV